MLERTLAKLVRTVWDKDTGMARTVARMAWDSGKDAERDTGKVSKNGVG